MKYIYRYLYALLYLFIAESTTAIVLYSSNIMTNEKILCLYVLIA